jgi:signal transduction histidine kinase
LSLRLGEKNVYLMIEDNGVGITPAKGASHSRSHGLKIMQERAEALEGNLNILSTPGQGTKIEVTIPLPPSEPHILP